MLTNLKSLKKDMIEKGWNIDSFPFEYNGQRFIILVILYDEGEKRPDYSLVKIEFIKCRNIKESLSVHTNSKGLLNLVVKEFRAFFNIEYGEKLGDVILSFTHHLSNFIPKQVSDNKNNQQKEAMELSLSKRKDSEDPNKKYCYKVIRNGLRANGELKKRSVYNDNITKIRRPLLYEKLKRDTNLSFCYSKKSNIEKTDEEILKNWTHNRGK